MDWLSGYGARKRARKDFKISDKRKELKNSKNRCQDPRCRNPKLIRNKYKKLGYIVEFDHFNNKPWDNRFENIKVVCPNCHRRVTVTGTRRRTNPLGFTTYQTVKKKVGYKKATRPKKRKSKRKRRSDSYNPFGFKPPRYPIY